MPDATDAEWDAAYAAFVGAFDTPLARRRDDNEFAQERRRLSAFNETMQKEAAELNDAWEAVAKWHDEQADKHGAWRDWGGPSDPVAQQKEAFHRECAKDLRARKVPKG